MLCVCVGYVSVWLCLCLCWLCLWLCLCLVMLCVCVGYMCLVMFVFGLCVGGCLRLLVSALSECGCVFVWL